MTVAGLRSVQVSINGIGEFSAGGIISGNLAAGIVQLLAEAKHKHLPGAFVAASASPRERQIFHMQVVEKIQPLRFRSLGNVLGSELVEHCSEGGAAMPNSSARLLR